MQKRFPVRRALLGVQAYAGPQHPASLLDADPMPRLPPGPEHLLEQLQPSPQLELQLGPQEVQVEHTCHSACQGSALCGHKRWSH